jgi:hypothetical protein
LLVVGTVVGVAARLLLLIGIASSGGGLFIGILLLVLRLRLILIAVLATIRTIVLWVHILLRVLGCQLSVVASARRLIGCMLIIRHGARATGG